MIIGEWSAIRDFANVAFTVGGGVLLLELECQYGLLCGCKALAHGRIGRVAQPHDAFLWPIYSCAGLERAI